MRRARFLPALLVGLSALTAGAASAQVSAKHGPLARLDGALQQAHADHADGEAVRVRGGQVGGGYVAVDVTAADGDGAALVRDLEAVGLRGAVAYGAVVSGRIPVAALGRLAALGGVQAARAVQGVTHGRRAGRSAPRPARSPVLVGAVDGEASVAMNVAATRDRLGLSGAGIQMGVLSDSYNTCAELGRPGDEDESVCRTTAAEDVASGDLPDNGVVVLQEPIDEIDDVSRDTTISFETDEGRAMMQLAYDVAPGLNFSFYTAFNGQAAFARGVVELADAGADVIVDDVLLFAEPFFQDGLVAQAVEEVVGRGIVYASSAGNQADQAYEADFVDSGLDANFTFRDRNGNVATDENGTPIRLTGALHDFNPGGERDAFQDIVLEDGESVTIVFQYAEPSFSASGDRDRAATSDYDIYLVPSPNRSATVLTVTGAGNNNIDAENGSGEPVEVISYTNETAARDTVYLAIALFSGEPRFVKYIDFDGQAAFEYAQEGNSTSVAHNNAANALNVGAAAWFNTPAFNDNIPDAIVNGFSSYGGSRIFFDEEGNRLADPENRMKPDVTGSDGDNNTFFGFDLATSNVPSDDDTNPNFFGTSAAAPNVAAITALMLEAAGGPGSLTPAEIYGILESTADDLTPFQTNQGTANFDTNPGYDVRSGFGFVRGDLALTRARATPTETAPHMSAFAIRDLGPNPVRSALSLTVEHGLGGDLTVGLYDVLGRRVALLHDGPAGPGGAVTLGADVRALPSGTYLVRAQAGGQSLSRAVTVVR